MNENGADHAEVNSMLKENKIGYLNFPIEEKNSKKLAKGCRGGCELLKQLLDHKKVNLLISTSYLYNFYRLFICTANLGHFAVSIHC